MQGPFGKGPLIGWYGDDFTGAAAVLEALAFAGLPSLLFLDLPTPEQLERAGPLTGIGIAGTARAQSPDWMDKNLPQVFAFLRDLGAPIVQYKICSTLDFSPSLGSIGRALDLGRATFGTSPVPIVTAAPRSRRYQVFGNLFAGFADSIFRLDRHPVMARHPATPMMEADVARHISDQTELKIGLVDLADLAQPDGMTRRLTDFANSNIAAYTIDDCDETSECAAGQLIWTHRAAQQFVIGSQGLNYALIAHWRHEGLLAPHAPPAALGRAPTMIVSGSVSPVTARQIAYAETAGFALVPLDAAQLVGTREARDAEIERSTIAALAVLQAGGDPLVFSARGPDDPSVTRFRHAITTLHQ